MESGPFHCMKTSWVRGVPVVVVVSGNCGRTKVQVKISFDPTAFTCVRAGVTVRNSPLLIAIADPLQNIRDNIGVVVLT